MKFKVLRGENQEVKGFSVIADPSMESEHFCETFPCAFLNQKAEIKFETDQIIFDHPACRFTKSISFKADSCDLKAIAALLEEDKESSNLIIERVPIALTESFQIRL